MSSNYLYGFTDTLSNTIAANVTANQLGSVNSQFNLRGVALAPTVEVPEPGTFSLIGLAVLGLFAAEVPQRLTDTG